MAQRKELARFSISLSDLSFALEGLANVFRNHSTLQELELIGTCERIRDDVAIYLRQLVQIPTKSLSISFNLAQGDYGSCLLAIRQGLDDLRRRGITEQRLPRICFRNVSFPNHKMFLHRFMAMLCEAQCVNCLQLNPRRRRHASASDSMRVKQMFLQAVARLLAFGNVQSLEIMSIVVDGPVEPRIVNEFYHALLGNTTLQRLSMPSTKGLDILWQQAIFPALTVNRTVRQLEFGHEMGCLPSFLDHLPLMKGLQSIQAPWRAHHGPEWVGAVQQSQHLTHVNFVMTPNVHSKTEETTEDVCLTQTRQLLERNRLIQIAREMIKMEPEPGQLMQGLAGMTCLEVGLDARFVLLRDSLALFAR